jgi:hypothetical protein
MGYVDNSPYQLLSKDDVKQVKVYALKLELTIKKLNICHLAIDMISCFDKVHIRLASRKA